MTHPLLQTPETLGYTILDGGFNALWVLEKDNRITKVMTPTDGGIILPRLSYYMTRPRPCLPRVFSWTCVEDCAVVEMEKLDVVEDPSLLTSLQEAWQGEGALGDDIGSVLSALHHALGHILTLDVSPDSVMYRDTTRVIYDMFDCFSEHHISHIDTHLRHLAQTLDT